MDLILCVAVGLVGGGCIGYVLGRELPRRCRECAYRGAERYRKGYGEGWLEGVAWTVDLVRKRATEAKNTWTITKDELERTERDALAVGESNRDGIPG